MVTRTINPLHFEDLDPHRFEDLIRQLIYDFKEWKSIEATGKLGSDDGIDILAIENHFQESFEEDKTEYIPEDRVWIIQCKREKNISPKRVKEIVEKDIKRQNEIPYGYILVASANFSKKSRDTFKLTLNELGVKEFYIYGKAEIEDLLFLPKYDHLLFAYFGISLQKRRTSVKSNLSARLTTKRKLIKHVGGLDDLKYKSVFVRPAQSLDYPKLNGEKPIWRYYDTLLYMPFNCISVITKRHLAYINWETKEWDYIDFYDNSFSRYPEIFDFDYEKDKNQLNHSKAYEKWDKLEQTNKGFYVEIRPIHFDRILLVDEIGDPYHNEAPHLVVDYINDSPFENKSHHFLESLSYDGSKVINENEIGKRIKIF